MFAKSTFPIVWNNRSSAVTNNTFFYAYDNLKFTANERNVGNEDGGSLFVTIEYPIREFEAISVNVSECDWLHCSTV